MLPYAGTHLFCLKSRYSLKLDTMTLHTITNSLYGHISIFSIVARNSSFLAEAVRRWGASSATAVRASTENDKSTTDRHNLRLPESPTRPQLVKLTTDKFWTSRTVWLAEDTYSPRFRQPGIHSDSLACFLTAWHTF